MVMRHWKVKKRCYDRAGNGGGVKVGKVYDASSRVIST